MTQNLVPAAQYLRMSTDHQQYSLENQAEAIVQYATKHSFELVKTYSDAAKSGLRLKNRDGLKGLLKDVVEGQAAFRAILVYDVSRWGRFQDADEAAHYEYLCKSSGVPVHYCAETFTNDTSGFILKALKRTMAGEYSRELSVKVRAGLFRLAGLGYKLGGTPPYGLRRMLLDKNGRPKQQLESGDRKSVANERVILVPGPGSEVAIVQRIFREFAEHHRSLRSIAMRLNQEQVPVVGEVKWNASAITRILNQSAYVGVHVWGRTTESLGGPTKAVPAERWAICPNAFQPILSQELFQQAQHALANLTCRLTEEQLLERLRLVLKEHGKLTSDIIQQSRLCPSAHTYYIRFGGLLPAYAQLGYEASQQSSECTTRQRLMLTRKEVFRTLVRQFPEQLQEVRRNGRFRSRLKYRRTGLLISLLIARCSVSKRGRIGWLLEPPATERARTTVVAFLGKENLSVESMSLFKRLDFVGKTVRIRAGDDLLKSGVELMGLSDFHKVISRF